MQNLKLKRFVAEMAAFRPPELEHDRSKSAANTKFWKHGPYLTVPEDVLTSIAPWSREGTEESRTWWVKPATFNVDKMLDFSWLLSKDGIDWVRFEPQFPHRNLSSPGINNDGQGARSA